MGTALRKPAQPVRHGAGLRGAADAAQPPSPLASSTPLRICRGFRRPLANLEITDSELWPVQTDDPQGHVVEISVTPWAFTSASAAALKNLVIAKYANGTSGSTLGPDGYAAAWTINGCEFRLNHG